MNSIAEIKSSLHQHISSTNDLKLLCQMEDYLKTLLEKKNDIIAFNANGKPLTRQDYKKQLDSIISSSSTENLISQDDMEREM